MAVTARSRSDSRLKEPGPAVASGNQVLRSSSAAFFGMSVGVEAPELELALNIGCNLTHCNTLVAHHTILMSVHFALLSF